MGWKEAAAEYREALRLRPSSVQARVNLGTVLLETGATAEAVEHYRAALAADPGLADVHFTLGVALGIYTGILLAIFGTALAIGQWRGLVAFVFIAISIVAMPDSAMTSVSEPRCPIRKALPAICPSPTPNDTP